MAVIWLAWFIICSCHTLVLRSHDQGFGFAGYRFCQAAFRLYFLALRIKLQPAFI